MGLWAGWQGPSLMGLKEPVWGGKVNQPGKTWEQTQRGNWAQILRQAEGLRVGRRQGKQEGDAEAGTPVFHGKWQRWPGGWRQVTGAFSPSGARPWDLLAVQRLGEVPRSCPTLRPHEHQAPPSMGFSRQEYWCGLPFPSPGDLSNPGIKPRSPALQADALPSEPLGKSNG